MKVDDAIIEALVKIGNHKKVKEACEPNIMQPQELKEWMVRRVIMAQELLQIEWERLSENTRRGI